jgi:N-methylhydantoinase A
MPSQIRIGADIGGTFTDIVFLDGHGNVRTAKVSSTPDDYARAISDAVADYFATGAAVRNSPGPAARPVGFGMGKTTAAGTA